MRLYLSSFRLGDHPERLVAMVDPDRPVAVIANAVDEDLGWSRPDAVSSEIQALAGLGLTASEVDLRDFFDAPDELPAVLAGFGALWVRGGNTFMLRYALRRSGGDAAVRDLLDRDDVVYAGYSAGCCVLAPSLRGLELCDDPEAVTRVYAAPVDWEGLGVIDFAFVPHVDSPGHPETELVAAVAQFYRDHDVRHRTLRDGQAIVVDGTSSQLC